MIETAIRAGADAAAVERIAVSAYTVPTDTPESDGTLEWSSTTIVVVEVEACGRRGVGYSYADVASARLIESKLGPIVEGTDALAVQRTWGAMVVALRNLGRPGLASTAVAAVDIALWDLKARLLELPLATLLGAVHASVAVYGSGGFTSYTGHQLGEQLRAWVERGIPRVKMKVGRRPGEDLGRVRLARQAIGSDAELYVDANGAYDRKQALAAAEAFTDEGVTWFEEPVSSDDLEGLRLLRDRAPAGMVIAAGEYGYDLTYFRRMLEAGAVDTLQADVTRCAGITELLRVAALCRAHGLLLSAHTAPSVHAHVCCAIEPLAHVEYFHDHVRVEELLFEGVLQPVEGRLFPDRSRPGLGLELRREDADRYAA